MRMTSNTRTTSTSGVTLMAAMVRALPPVWIVPAISGLDLGRTRHVGAIVLGEARDRAVTRAMRDAISVTLHRREDDVPQTGRLVLDVGTLLLEHVVEDDGRERDEDADRRRDQGPGDAAHDGAHGPHRVGAQLAECRDDAEHRAEEADEGRVVAQRTEEEQPGLELLAALTHGLGEDLFDGVGTVRVPLHGLSGDGRLDRAAVVQRFARGVEVTLLQRAPEAVRERLEIVATFEE